MGIEIKFYNLDTFKKQVDANCIDLNSEFVDLNYKVASLIFCHFWRSIQYTLIIALKFPKRAPRGRVVARYIFFKLIPCFDLIFLSLIPKLL